MEEKDNEIHNLYNIEAEQTVLGVIILNNEYFDSINEIIKKESFYEPIHSVIYEHIVYVLKEKKTVLDSITLKIFFNTNETLKSIGGDKYLSILLSMGAGIVDIKDYAKLINDLYRKRRLILLGEKIVNSIYKNSKISADKIIEDTENSIENIQKETEIKLNIKEDIKIANEEIYEIGLALKDPNYFNKDLIKTGFKDFDNKFNGLKKGELVILAARPSMGKSSLSLQIALNFIQQDKNVIFFSLEMSEKELQTKIFANISRINSEKIEKRQLSEEEFETIFLKSDEFLKDKNFFIDDTCAVNCNYIEKISRRIQRLKGEIDLIIVDYLQIMDYPKENEVKELGSIVVSLKNISKKFNCAILCLSQLNRSVELREDKRPFLNDLRGSGNIEETANMVIFCYRNSYYLQKELSKFDIYDISTEFERKETMARYDLVKNDLELLVRKNRRGQTGDCMLYFDPRFSLIRDKISLT